MKSCSKCGVEKELVAFSKCKKAHDGLNFRCRDCCKQVYQEWKVANVEKLKEVRRKTDAARTDKKKQYRQENKEHIKQYHERYYENENNKNRRDEKRRDWVKNNPDKITATQQKYKQSEHGKKAAREYRVKKRANDSEFKIACVVRSRIARVINGGRKYDSSFELVGCSPEFLKKYIEWQFDDGMTWDNHGIHWHIDHIIPLSWFDLTDPEQQKLAFDFTNMQPLLARDNLSKSNRWSD